jgi:hypothetical protein
MRLRVGDHFTSPAIFLWAIGICASLLLHHLFVRSALVFTGTKTSGKFSRDGFRRAGTFAGIIMPIGLAASESVREILAHSMMSGELLASIVSFLPLTGLITYSWMIGVQSSPRHAAFLGSVAGFLGGVILQLLGLAFAEPGKLLPADLYARLGPAAYSVVAVGVLAIGWYWSVFGLLGGFFLDLQIKRGLLFAYAFTLLYGTAWLMLPRYVAHSFSLPAYMHGMFASRDGFCLLFVSLGMSYERLIASPKRPLSGHLARCLSGFIMLLLLGLLVLSKANLLSKSLEGRTIFIDPVATSLR